jgi:hypothetical protein
MDLKTEWTPTEVLDRAEAYFARGWPYAGGYSRNGATSVVFVGEVEAPNEITEFLKVLVFGALTFGIYFLYWIFTHDRNIVVPRAEIVATPEEGGALVTTRATKPEHQAALDGWAREELGGTPL